MDQGEPRRDRLVDRLRDPQPDSLSRHIAAADHQSHLVDRFELRLVAVLLDQQLCAAPDVDVRDHGAIRG
jgi:hypothetical protein